MMTSGTSFSPWSFFSLLHTEKPFMRGSSIESRMRSGLSVAACWRPTFPSSTTVVAHPSFPSSFRSSPAKAGSLSNTRTLVAMGCRRRYHAWGGVCRFERRCLFVVAARPQTARQLGQNATQRNRAPPQADDQVVQRVGRLADDSIVALRLERAHELPRLLADLAADGRRASVVEALRVARRAGRLLARLEHRLERGEERLRLVARLRQLAVLKDLEEAARRAGVTGRPCGSPE